MDTMSAFLRGERARRLGARLKVFDWHKAADLIRESGSQDASAGLRADWENTGGPIFADGKPVPKEDTYVYLASIWATPELSYDGGVVDCWRYAEGEGDWTAETYWPETALARLQSPA